MKQFLILFFLLLCIIGNSQINLSDVQFEKKRVEIENFSSIKIDSALQQATLIYNYSLNSKSLSKIAKAQSTLSYLQIMATFTDEAL